jgi:peptidoglycan/LPS O-acetylase OafA/YrhL
MAPYFAVGMLAALLAYGRELDTRTARGLLAAGVGLVLFDAAWAAVAAHGGSRDLTLHVLRDLVAACGFGAVLVAVTCGRAPRLLCARPLALVGLWSYGVYLWHVPLLLWLRGHGLLPDEAWAALAVVTPPTLLVAAASWRLLERPAQDWARRAAAGRPRHAGGRPAQAAAGR